MEGSVSSTRVMQLALAATILFSLVYMYQFFEVSMESNEVEHSAFKSRVQQQLMQERVVVQGFQEGYDFVKEYDVKRNGPLYILFMSDANENHKYWCRDCERAKKPIYDGFARAPNGSHIVEIRIGPEREWANMQNSFRQNQLFYIDNIPSLMRYDGGGNTSEMLSEKYTLNDELLDYVFRVPNPSGPPAKNNQIVELHTPEEIMAYLDNYDGSYPLYMFFISGHHKFNGRLWCRYCDQAHIAIDHFFNTSAPDNAVLLHGVVAPTYKKWKKKKHPLKQPAFQDNYIQFKGVPWLGRISKDSKDSRLTWEEFLPDFADHAFMRAYFAGGPGYPQN